jgi:hypothetical protein
VAVERSDVDGDVERGHGAERCVAAGSGPDHATWP